MESSLSSPSSSSRPADSFLREPSILAREGDLWVFFKPAGYNTHPPGTSSGEKQNEKNRERDMVSWARSTYPQEGPFAPIHRLDRETSGVILFTPRSETCREAGKWFAAGEVKKRYLALVTGRTRKHGIIRRPLKTGRFGKSQEAVTRYRLLEWVGPFSLLQVSPEQGRRHQIRRHLKGIGHPIVGDSRYARHLLSKTILPPGRLWLHAWCLELPDGRLFEAPLPGELESHLHDLRKRYENSSRESTDDRPSF